MADLDGTLRQKASTQEHVRLLPDVADADGNAKDITTSVRFGPYSPGDWISISSTKDFHILPSATAAGTADATDHPIPAGVHDFVVPTGVAYVNVFSAESGALGNAWKS